MVKTKSNLKIINIISALLVLSVIVTWLLHGAEIFTKTKILVDKTTELDKMLGVKNEVWVDKFILGFDYSALAIAIIILTTFTINYYSKTKRKES